MDRRLSRPPAWRKLMPYAAVPAVVVGMAAWLLMGAGGNVYRVSADQITVGRVTRGPFEDFIALRAVVAPYATSYLTADQGGTVKAVLIEDGAVVKAGQPLIVLSNSALEQMVASREAETARQISDLRNTELQLEQTRFRYEADILDIEYQLQTLKGTLARDRILNDAHAIALATYLQDQDKYAYEVKVHAATTASHAVQQKLREAQRAQLKRTLSDLDADIVASRASLAALTIRAPVDGQLTALDAQIGQSKPQGTVLGQVDSLARFKLTAQVDEFYLGQIARGQEAVFAVDGRDYRARVDKIYPKVANGTFKADLLFVAGAPVGIHNGQTIDLKLELGGKTVATMLPNGPFYQDTGGNWAFVVDPDGGSAGRRSLRLGRRNLENVEVLDGLKPGDRVIVSSYQGFQTVDRVELAGAPRDGSDQEGR
ncbi:MAG: HlyD family efflux transporter periplasmic adaptor subunit [Rhizomicrobium sp.]